MDDAGALKLPPKGATPVLRRCAARPADPESAAAPRRRVPARRGTVWRRISEGVGPPVASLRARLWPAVGAGDLLIALPLLFEPALVSGAGVGRVALAVLVFGLLSRVADRLDALALQPDRGRPQVGRGTLGALSGALFGAGVRALGLLALALVGALALGVGFTVAAGAFLAVQSWRAVAGGRSVTLAILMLVAAIVLRVDAGAVALGAAPGSHIVAYAGLFGLFAGLCQYRERLFSGSADAPGWLVELVRRYLDVVTAALLSGLIVGCVLVLGRDPVLRVNVGAWAYLSAPFVLAGLLRYWHLAVVEERPVARGSLPFIDPWLAVSALGGAAALALAPYL